MLIYSTNINENESKYKNINQACAQCHSINGANPLIFGQLVHSFLPQIS